MQDMALIVRPNFDLNQPSSEIVDLIVGWFTAERTPTFILDENAVLLSLNEQACSLLEREDDFLLVDGRLTFHQRSQNEVFNRFVSQLSYQASIWSLPESSAQGFWILRGQVICTHRKSEVISMAIRSTSRPKPLIWANLSTPFGLTRSEDRVARRLFEGISASEIAQELDISIETSRTYIRRIYQKTGATNREQLLKTLAPFKSE